MHDIEISCNNMLPAYGYHRLTIIINQASQRQYFGKT